MLPREVFGCSGMTCWRHLRDWQQAGMWDRLHRVLLDRLNRAGELDWSRGALDAASIAAKRGGRDGPEPDRPGPHGHEEALRHGPPGHAARPDDHGREPPRQHGARIHARRRAGGAVGTARPSPQAPGQAAHPLSGHRCAIPCRVTDKAYDHRRCRKECRARSIIPRIARRGLETSTKLGRHQWVVERTFAWFAQFVRRASPSQPATTAAPISTWPSPSSQPPS
ncbi:hypothetical protein JSE7799_01459 [Jannaschia seosinensis]|uniref:Transposase n=1 Tax=Jannaschia seosinensis TaxID=313367 RepID=A0A0M7B968_9RHOB|nr:hypothetical protein JSE7799_01459 [Jannaschia seosinensis]